MARLGAAGVAGGLLAVSVPPAGIWPAGIAGVALLAWSVRDASWGARLVRGLLAGAVLFIVTLSWILAFTGLGFVLLIALEASFVAAACVLAGPRSALALAPALALGEWARSVWPFGGLPMGGIALGQARGPLAPLARLGGPTLIVLATAALGAALVLRGVPATRLARAAVVVLVVAGLTAAARIAPDGGPDGARLRIVAVQGGGQRGFRKADVDPTEVFARHVVASDRVRPPVDVVLWPEDVIDVDAPVGTTEEGAEVGALARRVGAVVVAGAVEGAGDTHFRNAAVAWGPDGGVVDRYEKAHRVPFGEWVPGRSLVARITDLSAVPRDAIAGRGPAVLRTPKGRFAVAISFEVFDPARARSGVRAGGAVLLVPTNTASYRGTQVPEQEAAAVRLRALESGRWVVQASPTGHALVARPDGRIVARSALDRRAVIHGTVRRRHGRTPYVTWGDLPVLAAAGLALVAIRLGARRASGPRGQEAT